MKKMKGLCALFALAAFVLGGCASYLPMGVLYTQVNGPAGAGGGPASYTKVGTAQAQSVLGLVATGDASIEAAVKNGNIKTIKYVDWHTENILGIIGTYTTKVYGD